MKTCPECKGTYPNDYALCPKDGAPLNEITLWQIGTVVRDKYRILARLGEGGMAVVYKAHHELLDELRALKVIRPDLAGDAEFISRFKNEAIMARRLNHPNAVRVDDLDIAEDGLPFISMELVVGDTLKTLIQRVGPLPVSLVLDVSSHVCEALDAAHALGLVHRDIKPENIVLIAQHSGPPVAKILDFGISRLREQPAGQKGLTQTGMVIGTPEYMSPEQAMGKRGEEIDGRSDLYSLGIVMYRMLTGELPFQAETTVEMILHQLKTVPRPPHQLKPELAIPPAVSAIVMKALEKDRGNRFATGGAMAAAIKKARGSITLSSQKVDWDTLSSTPASFGLENSAPQAGASRDRPSATPSRTPAPHTSATGKTMYRSSARIAPPGREFPVRGVVMALVLAGLIAGGYFGWPYYQSWRLEGRSSSAPAVPGAAASVTTAGEEKGGVIATIVKTIRGWEKMLEGPSEGAGASAAPSAPTQHKTLTYQEQAKVKELNSLGAIYLRQGGCEKAMPIYQQVMDIDYGNAIAWKGMQNCYAKTKMNQPRPVPPPPNPPSPQ
jgi:serine/threonine protein kinase